ncbi:hypothetical protein FACS1894155_10520 [Bacteroidia bacterium]|nr:hypothetical protein FACS1894155_10520 [Bacteroidia bacterium]
MITIKDITGEQIEVTNLNAAIRQCKDCLNSPYKMECGHTVGENYAFMLKQLIVVQQEERRNSWLPGTKKRYEEGKRFTKIDIGYEIGRHEPYHPASLYWDSLHRKELIVFFNDMFGTDIK